MTHNKEYKGPYPFTEGKTAGYMDKDAKNPYPQGSRQYRRWDEGYLEGRKELKSAEYHEELERQERERLDHEDYPWNEAKATVSDCGFTEDQVYCLHNMIDKLREIIE